MNDLEKTILDEEYLKTLSVYQFSIGVLDKLNKYELIPTVYEGMLFWEKQYIDFRLKEFDSESRCVIREAYKVLGYNPYNPKSRRSGKK